jgi:UPF0716 protein FxsA
MRRPISLTTAIGLWLVAEVIVFVIVVHNLGLVGALALGLLTSLVGAATLRRLGARALLALQRTVQGGQPSQGALLDGALAALGGLLLVLPGFLTDVLGLALAAPSVRQWLGRRYGSLPRPAKRAVLDLSPQEWRSVEDRSLSN